MLLQITDVIIGLAVVFVIFSAIASECAELLESKWRKRSTFLVKGLGEIFAGLGSPVAARHALLAFFNSPQIASLYSGRAVEAGNAVEFVGGRPPSYVPADRFSAAVLWLSAPSNPVTHSVQSGPPPTDEQPDVRPTMQKLIEVATQRPYGNTEEAGAAVGQALADFYLESTDRFAGWYRSHVRMVLFGFGLLIAILFNVDTLHIMRTLSQDSELRTRIAENVIAGDQQWASLASAATVGDDKSRVGKTMDGAAAAGDPIAQLKKKIEDQQQLVAGLGLPIGWSHDLLPPTGLDWLGKVAGFLLTALALCAGSPFWFDLLGKLVELRSTVKPDEQDNQETTPRAIPQPVDKTQVRAKEEPS